MFPKRGLTKKHFIMAENLPPLDQSVARVVLTIHMRSMQTLLWGLPIITSKLAETVSQKSQKPGRLPFAKHDHIGFTLHILGGGNHRTKAQWNHCALLKR
jgi:hypothetical protein